MRDLADHDCRKIAKKKKLLQQSLQSFLPRKSEFHTSLWLRVFRKTWVRGFRRRKTVFS